MFGMSFPKSYFDVLKEKGSLVLNNFQGKLVIDSGVPVVKLVLVDNPYEPNQQIFKEIDSDNLIYGLVSADLTLAKEYFPSRYFDAAPYEGRPFYHGLLDCYTLLQDWYAREKGVTTPHNVERPWMWWMNKQSLYLQHAAEFGFIPVKGNMQVGDVMIFKLGSSVANHCGIYMGDNKILHHINGRLSCIEPIKEKFTQQLIEVVRYKDAKF